MARRLIIFALGALAAAGCGTTGDVAAMPTADAGFDHLGVPIGTLVTLDGSASSDPDGGTLTYTWTLESKPSSTSTEIVAGTDAAQPTLTPDRAGSYLISLRVSNGSRDSRVDVVIVEADNGAPIAVAECRDKSGTTRAPACPVLHGRTADLIGTLSEDPDGGTLSYNWTQVTAAAECATTCPGLTVCTPDAAALTIINAVTNRASVTFPQTRDRMYVFLLTVSDGFDTGTDCVSYTTANTPPTVGIPPYAQPSQPTEAVQFQLLTLGSDLDNDSLTFAWTQDAPASPAVLPAPADQSTILVTVPLAGTYTFRVTISDGLVADDVWATADVTVVP